MITFGLIGNGTISARHKEAIKHVGGLLYWISDPVCLHGFYDKDVVPITAKPPSDLMYSQVDYVIICSPTNFHRQQTQEALKHGCKVICEKPLCLPWEPLIDDDRINIVLQLRWIKDLPKKADLVRAIMVRDDKFFESWKGDPRLAGGNIYEFFIHYIDLSIQLGAGFEGQVLSEGKQERKIIVKGRELLEERIKGIVIQQIWSDPVIIDIMAIDMQDLYNRMYEDILIGKGVKPKDIFFLTWLLNEESTKLGYRYGGVRNKINIARELL